MSEHPRDCEHGRQWGHCPECDLNEALAELQEARRLLKYGQLETWGLEGDCPYCNMWFDSDEDCFQHQVDCWVSEVRAFLGAGE